MNKSPDKYFLESSCFQLRQKGACAPGDICFSNRTADGRTIVVLVHAAGSGVKAHVQATVTASMILTSMEAGSGTERVIDLLRDYRRQGPEIAATTAEIEPDGTARILEYNAGTFSFFRRGLPRQAETAEDLPVRLTRIKLEPGDRCLFPTGSVYRSGYGTKRLPRGWREEGMAEFARKLLEQFPDISAGELCRKIVEQAQANDMFSERHDLTCAALYFRPTRSLLLCSGPPFDEKNDKIMARTVHEWQGGKIICGGTTATILSRELRKEISVNLGRDVSGLPPTSRMEGVDLITEGVLTLSRVRKILEEADASGQLKGKGIDYDLARRLLDYDHIHFLVGTRVNQIHQDPNLPMELELRKTIIRDIKSLLESKFLKRTGTQYI